MSAGRNVVHASLSPIYFCCTSVLSYVWNILWMFSILIFIRTVEVRPLVHFVRNGSDDLVTGSEDLLRKFYSLTKVFLGKVTRYGELKWFPDPGGIIGVFFAFMVCFTACISIFQFNELVVNCKPQSLWFGSNYINLTATYNKSQEPPRKNMYHPRHPPWAT